MRLLISILIFYRFKYIASKQVSITSSLFYRDRVVNIYSNIKMFCLVFSQSRLCVATIIFYTCIWIPYLRIKQSILAFLSCLLLSLGLTTCQQMENLQVIAAASSSSSTSCLQDYYYPCQRYYDNQQQQELEDEEVLPVVRFEDHCYLRNLNNGHGSSSSSSRAVVECSVCLGEFRSEDEVSQLRGCGHVFHLRCIKNWLDRNHFTCPLCRSVFLDAAQFYRSKYSSASSHQHHHHVDHHLTT